MSIFVCIILAGALFSVFCVSFLDNLSTRKIEGKRNIGLIAFTISIAVLLFVAAFSDAIVRANTKEYALISTVKIEEIYKGNNGYIVKDNEGNIYQVPASNIYKGDSNYIVNITYPRVTKFIAFWTDIEKCQYKVVVKDLNIGTLPTLQNE